jgi:hypothetical protein
MQDAGYADLPLRLAERIAVGEGCWIWQGTQRGGYGRAKANGKQTAAHRVVYEALVGPIPDGLVLDHLCLTPLCVNPAHLEPVTRAENVRRAWRAGLNANSALVSSSKTHCPQGHPYDEVNTYVNPTTRKRSCRECLRANRRRYYHRKKAADVLANR